MENFKNREGINRILNIVDKVLIFVVTASVITFILFPMWMVMVKSVNIGGEFSLSMYKSLLMKNSKLIYNSLIVAVSTTVLTTIMTIIISVYASIANKWVSRFINLTLMLTMISPPFVTSLSYITLFGRRGFITHDILGLTLNTYGFYGIVLMQSLGFISLSSILLIGIIKSLNMDTIQSARDLGADTSSIITDIIIPMIRPGILVVAVLAFVRSLADFSTPAIIGGSFNTLAAESYYSVIAYSNINRAAAINTLIFIPALIGFLIFRHSMEKLPMVGGSTTASESKVPRSGILYYVFGVFTFLFLFALIMQYGSILLSAITKKQRGVMYFTLDNIIESKNHINTTIFRSIGYSLIAAIGGTAIGYLLSYYREIRKLKWMKAVDFIATMPYIIPGTFFGLGYILAFNDYPLPLTGTAAIVIINVLFKQLPFSAKIADSTLKQIRPESIDACKDLGGHEMNVLKDVLVPSSKPGFFLSFINNFTATMTTVGSIIFLVYPGQKLATLIMFDVIQSGKYRIGAVIACLLILVVMLFNISFYLLFLSDKKPLKNKTKAKGV